MRYTQLYQPRRIGQVDQLAMKAQQQQQQQQWQQQWQLA
jgi:hypothetical protein